MSEAKDNVEYISFDEFVHNSGRKESIVKKRIKDIPGITKADNRFQVVSGTRYPCDLHRRKYKNSGDRRYALLKAISQYEYASHRNLRVEQKQFEGMLRELLDAGLIQPNNLCNTYGANAYDCTPLGDKTISRTDKAVASDIMNMIAETSGTFTGVVISQVMDNVA